MSDNRPTKYKFSGHQTFVFRYGWLEKGVRGVLESETVFADADAMVRLGVGKNMVESIRHWCLATQLLDVSTDSTRNHRGNLRVSKMGHRLLSEGGWDPYLEDDATLWLLHWLLVSNPGVGTTWQIAFSAYHRPDFTKGELIDYLLLFAEKESLRVKRNVMARDVDCFLRSYVHGAGSKKPGVVEESFDCPLQELNLIQSTPDGELFRFAVGPKPSLPAAVFGYSLCQYFERIPSEQSTLSIQECMYGPGSPGQVFKLDENSLIEYVEELEETSQGAIAVDETAGLKQVYRRRRQDAMDLLSCHYAGSDAR